MKIDTHIHTSGVSSCSTVSYRQMVDAYLAAGYGAVVLTNHLNGAQLSAYSKNYEGGIKKYLAEYALAKSYGDKKGLKVFFGAEVALRLPDCPYSEFLLIGIDEKFIFQYPKIFDYTLKDFYATANSYGALVYQAHPFRAEHGHFPHDPRYYDGLEINCHKNFLRQEDKVIELARKYNKKISCGSDFHYLSQAGSAGMIVPDSVDSAAELAAYLKETEKVPYFFS